MELILSGQTVSDISGDTPVIVLFPVSCLCWPPCWCSVTSQSDTGGEGPQTHSSSEGQKTNNKEQTAASTLCGNDASLLSEFNYAVCFCPALKVLFNSESCRQPNSRWLPQLILFNTKTALAQFICQLLSSDLVWK